MSAAEEMVPSLQRAMYDPGAGSAERRLGVVGGWAGAGATVVGGLPPAVGGTAVGGTAVGGTAAALPVVGAVLLAGGNVALLSGELGAPGWIGWAPCGGVGPGGRAPRPLPLLAESTPTVARTTSASATVPIFAAFGNPRSLRTIRFNSALSTAPSPVP
jgi:hypothetical protein